MSSADIVISICICTYRRDSVLDTINALLAQRQAPFFEIVVADDDPLGGAREVVTKVACGANIPIRYILSGSRNISVCRNACLQAAKAPIIGFIDDDQVCGPEWLCQIYKDMMGFSADAVKSFVRGIYPPETPAWIREGDPYTYDYGPTGKKVKFAASGGILFSLAIPGAENLRFRDDLGKSGGEDFEFFLRYQALGGVIVSSRGAVVQEVVPASRVTARYLRHRSRRHGHINGKVLFVVQAPRRRLITIAKSLIGIVVSAPYFTIYPISRGLSCKMYIKLWYHWGVLEWAAGRRALAHA